MTNLIDLTGEADSRGQQAIDITSDSEDEDLKLAIAMSLQEQHAQTMAGNHEALTTQVPRNPTSGLAGLNRKAMETERLARLKRKRGVEEDEIMSMVEKIPPLPVRKQATSDNMPISTNKEALKPPGLQSNPFYFLAPKVLLTSNPSRHGPHGLEAISMRDVISAPKRGLKLKSVLLSSFIADFDWLLPHFDTQSTNFVVVLHAQSAEHRRLLQSDFAGVPNVRLVLPQCMGGSGNMHSKIMVCFFKSEQADQESEICRIVITSANLTPTDWGVGNVMENVVFVMDAPRKTETRQGMKTQFEQKFTQQLQAMEVPDKVIQRLENFDLRAAEHVQFVASISQSRAINFSPEPRLNAFRGLRLGSVTSGKTEPDIDSQHTDSREQIRVGLLAMSDAVSALGLSMSISDAAYPPRLDFITSSLGNLSTVFLRQLYSAVCGTLNPDSAGAVTKPKSKMPTADDKQKHLDDLIQKSLRIIFPSDKTVRESKGGPVSAGTICFQRKWWDDNDIIKDCLYDCIGVRGDGILMHSKVCKRV